MDGMYAAIQMRGLVEPLYASWTPAVDDDGAAQSFIALANVGVFGGVREAPLVPDALVSVGVSIHPDAGREKRHNTYFIWEMGKPPDVVIEVVSNHEGDELGKRRHGYRRWKVPFYVVWDPFDWLHEGELLAFELKGDLYIPCAPDFPSLGLSLRPWEGELEHLKARWLRWHDAAGALIPSGAERADTERERADSERARAERLRALLAEHGIDPESAG